MKVKKRFWALPVLGLLLSMLCGHAIGAAPAPGAFEAGTSAYRAGHYQEALNSFLQARSQGNTSEQLQYNIGVTYYRLGDYPHARTSFETLTAHPKSAALAHYNLGLVALKVHDNKVARAEFERASKTTTHPNLSKLAKRQLHRLDAAPGSSIKHKKTKPAKSPAANSVPSGDKAGAVACKDGTTGKSGKDACALHGGVAKSGGPAK